MLTAEDGAMNKTYSAEGVLKSTDNSLAIATSNIIEKKEKKRGYEETRFIL